MLGFGFWIEQFELATGSHRFGFCSGFYWNEVKFERYLCLWLEIWTVSFDPWLWISSGKLVLLLLLFSDSNLANLFTFSSSSLLIRILRSHWQRATSGGVLVLELQMLRFNDEDSPWISENYLELHQIGSHFVSDWYLWIGFEESVWIGAEIVLD